MAEQPDHRKLGRELSIFVSSPEVGAGLPLFPSAGAIIRRELVDYQREILGADYQEVVTPHIGKVELYEKSGHYPYYKDSQFPIMEEEGERYLLKPMNCPHHIQIYKAALYSYRDLPYRTIEFGTCYRHEQTGEVSGLTRVRSLTIDDSHLFVTEGQIKEEVGKILDHVEAVYQTFGFTYRFELSARDSTDTTKFAGDDTLWKRAEDILREVLVEKKLSFTEVSGGAAFYGPKIDLFVKDSLDREWQLATIQLDFVLPERFELRYATEDGWARPVMIHRAIYGSLERFLGVLIEHYAGAFPFWLAPVQVKLLPVTDGMNEKAEKIAAQLRAGGVRVAVDQRSEGVGRKIRDAELEKVPYSVIVGEKEAENELAVRARGGEQSVAPLEKFLSQIQAEKRERN
jgi:threonyl-tRNA synthetase